MLLACERCHRQYDVGDFPAGARVRCACGHLCVVPAARRRQVEMLHCASCGGRLEGARTTCAYCAAEVRLEDRGLGPACPECFATTLADARHCSTCGVRLAPEAVLRALVERPCPRCKQALVECSSPDVRYVECTRCGGLWLDEALFERIARERDGPLVTAVRGLPAAGTPAKSLEADVRYLPCPVCAQLMNRRNFASASGVVLDWCRGHGWWFDAQELERVLTFLEKGGLERARAAEHERRLGELRRERERAALPASLPIEGTPRQGLIERLVELLMTCW